ncbi:MAG: type IVB secretion system lipoprotein DotD [Proteobacteria bacterium]|nr:type IVB secretion system lipoprotein DotD [Pseudomonadota bacterium]
MEKQLLLISLLSILVGCTPKPTYEMSDVEYQLMKSAMSVENSLKSLAATKDIYAKNAINTDILVTPQGGMGGLASLDWSGPIEPLLEKVAEMTRYRVKVLGPIPAIPVIVTISSRERVVADILKDAGLQAGKRANLIVYPTSRIIELRYAANV